MTTHSRTMRTPAGARHSVLRDGAGTIVVTLIFCGARSVRTSVVGGGEFGQSHSEQRS